MYLFSVFTSFLISIEKEFLKSSSNNLKNKGLVWAIDRQELKEIETVPQPQPYSRPVSPLSQANSAMSMAAFDSLQIADY
ncbi:PH, RCC1 and FYVE domains-containing protein 1-like isoform X1 [Salvia divinorum]|uniref:PH, RCC1 and FYVE domains-containing protein 1-like isoform X1 n=1 Tax=Salvia divinorum TaxID=28513 RepID=A0ABD1GK70_SALDI